MIRILVDSTADLTAEEISAMGIKVVPLLVNFDGTMYRDGIDLPLEQFFEMLAAAEKLPTTTQPSPESFIEHFEVAKAADDTLICILLSSEISGTLQSATIAKDEVGYDKIFIVDSKCATLGTSLLVRRAYENIIKGMTAEKIVKDLEKAREHLHLFAIVDDLKYLRKGGRLSGAAAIAGGLLGIKPVVGVRAHEGTVGLLGKARGLPGAYLAIFKMIEEVGGVDESYPVVVGYTGKRHTVEPFLRYVTQNLNLQKPLVNPIGTVIGTHAGPGACGIAFFDNK